MKSKIIILVAFAALLVTASAATYAKGAGTLPPDNATTTSLKWDHLMGSRYTEILLVFVDPTTKKFMAGVYNTTGLNGANVGGGGDSCPAPILDSLDMEKVKSENGAASTVKNGPRLWTVDHIGAKVGRERDFQGLKARWVMWFPIPDAIRQHKDLSYAIMNARRDTSMSIDKGSRAYILDDPQGNSWVMKSASLITDPNQKFEDLKNLGSRLKLPKGWKFRTPILKKNLVFMTDHGATHITQDELGNTYDRVGGPYSNYKP